MPLNRIFALCALCLLTSACASLVAPKVATEAEALKPGAYALDMRHAALTFKVDHLGFSNYVGRFERFDASLDFDADNPSAARVEAIIDMTSLDIADDEFAETLMGPDWFDAAAHPQGIFKSIHIEITGETSGRMTGDLTLKGATHPVTLDVTFNGGANDILRGGYIVGFSARGIFDRTLFGIDKFDGVVGNNVTIEIEAEFERR